MAATLNDFYLKYRNKVARSLENDAYYQYLFDLIEASPNVIEQTNRILHKEVDEKWLTRVEEGIQAIDMIISRPRKFIATNEVVVPVELAKKITAESVKHLSRNTQFIGEINGDTIRPSKILNVTTEESYNLYENRFIYTLIKKLVAFIDKRTDIIFWSSGDERESHLCVSSDLDDDYESISYKLELNIKNKQSYMETDAQHMEVFKRIDRVRRIVMEFRKAPFMQIMEGMPEVRPPIQRTNLLMKDPHYKKCYSLWAFLEQYDNVGYTIDIKETALDFDEEYLYQVYTNMIMNYTVFKSLLEDDNRPIDQNVKKRKKIKPKFVKQIVEEIVDDYDIPDVEVRKVIIEEITRAQARIEQRQAEAEKRRAAREKQKEKERLAREKEKARKKAAEDKEKARLKALADKEKAKKKAAGEKEKARLKALADKEREKQKAMAAKAREKERLAKQKEKERLARQKEKERELARAKAEKEREKARAKAAADKEKARLKAEAEKEKAQNKTSAEKEKQKTAVEVVSATKTDAAEPKAAKAKAAVPKASAFEPAHTQETVSVPEPAAEPKSVSKAELVAEPATVSKPETAAEPATVAKPETAAEPATVAKPETAPRTEEELARERQMEAVRRANEAARCKAEQEQNQLMRLLLEKAAEAEKVRDE